MALYLKRSFVWLVSFLLVWCIYRYFSNQFSAANHPFFHLSFGFLAEPSGFQISESPIFFEPNQPLWRAFAVGLANTLKASIVSILLSGFLGLAIGLGRLSAWSVIRKLSGFYVESLRNLPLLLQILAWYFLLSTILPVNEQAWHTPVGSWFEGFYLSKAGLFMPGWVWDATGQGLWQKPTSFGFSISGGWSLSPEFLTICLALSTYTGAYLAEIVRAGMQSVPIAQKQAGLALGLLPRQVMRWIVLPQAIRLIILPATNQWLSLVKNSSLAVAIGYPELMSISNTTLNQTGRAIECLLLGMAIYLVISLLISTLSALYNSRLNQFSQKNNFLQTI